MATRTAKRNRPTTRVLNYILSKGKSIGSGAYRIVYKTDYGKWVVKVNRCNGLSEGNNEHEYAAYLSLKSALKNKLPDNVRIPEMHLIGEYLVAEYVKGKHPDTWCWLTSSYDPVHSSQCRDHKNCWITRLQGIRIRDIHRLNVILTYDDILYIVDIGHGED